ncbi:MAG TPA: dethiobiotin synthase, partial [Burkholderiales bacterium]|nr:dethiobiotin synthase [Burkholderiales bacterium]
MNAARGPSWFVTGTDTGVGKSLVAAALLHACRARGYTTVGMKPVAAGCELIDGEWRNEDVEALIAASSVAAPRELVNPYLFRPPIAPHIAAAEASVLISSAHIAQCCAQLAALAQSVVVEGAGGFLVPLGKTEDMGDLAKVLGLPVVLVVGMRLGCLNHALLSAEAIRARGLTLAGWVANRIDPEMPRFEEN